MGEKKKKKEIVTIYMRYVLYDNSDMHSDTAPYTHPSEVKAQDRRHDGLLVQTFYIEHKLCVLSLTKREWPL